MTKYLACLGAASIVCQLSAFSEEIVITEPSGSIPMLSVEESLKTFHLPEGYRLEAVLTDPIIAEPVVCAFDGNGRMYVAEMRTYMQDADATGENEPISRVSLHEDTNGDGKMDKHSIFVDKLLLPRIILPLDDRVLIQETNTLDIYSYRDTDGDGVADEKELFFKGGPRGGNMEHQPSGLIWSMDNWLYATYSAFRIRYNHDGETLKEATAHNGGQWGLCQDDYGKPWFVNAGREIGPLNFQQPIVYGAFNLPSQQPLSYREVFPLVGIPDVQGGSNRFRLKSKTLNHFTATCGPEIFRGDRLPEELRGDLLFSEPVGRLIRRSKVKVHDGITSIKNAHPGSEFIRSTDPNFRAVNMTTGPDGCLYIVDMHRGIIQQGGFMPKGSYLHKVVKEYGLDKNIAKGRIYRLVHKDFKPGTAPKMLSQSAEELVSHLEHPNGWWRDTAQKLLILRRDLSTVPALESLVKSSPQELARMHALWTLEGMGVLRPSLLREAFRDAQASLRRAAIRVSESLYKAGDHSFAGDIEQMTSDADPDVAIQALLTAKLLNLPKHREWITSANKNSPSAGIKGITHQILRGAKTAPPKLPIHQLAQYKKGQAIYQTLCVSCHGAKGRGTKLGGVGGDALLAPSLANSSTVNRHPELSIKVLLHGLTGPIDGKSYPGIMIGMASNGDPWIADVLSYVRNSFGNQSSFISENQVKEIRLKNADRKTAWTLEELRASAPQSIQGKEQWKLTASHNAVSAKLVVDQDPTNRYTTGEYMKPGMWFQIELVEVTKVAALTFDAGRSIGDYPRSYKVETSQDGENWQQVAEGKGGSAKITAIFNPTSSKFLKITQTGNKSLFWSIEHLDILQAK